MGIEGIIIGLVFVGIPMMACVALEMYSNYKQEKEMNRKLMALINDLDNVSEEES